MTIRFRFQSRAVRLGALGALLSIYAGLGYAVVCDFVIGALSDDRISVTAEASDAFITAPFEEDRIGINPDVLAAGAGIFAVLIQSLSDTDSQIPSNALLFLVLSAVVSQVRATRKENA